jgi:NAD(P)H-dependent flavin oxidoreductase YrpB (nitropropane dioxygenase family)
VPLRTPLCDLLGIEVPILSVGFGAGARPELAAAVSNAGGLGVIGLAGGGITLEQVAADVATMRTLTRKPFGGNVIIVAFDSGEFDEDARAWTRERIDAAIELRVPVLVLFWGDATPFVAPAHRAGVKVLLQVGSADEAAAAVRAGVDAVILQGLEAGGHVRATRSLWDELPRAIAACGKTPILAAGGIGDGRAIARALSLGAQGVSMGTRFVASAEAWAHPHYKQRIVDASPDEAFLSKDLYYVGWPGAPHRALKNRTFARWDAAGRPPVGKRPGEGEVIGTLHMPWGDLPWHRYQTGMLTPTFDGDPEDAVMWAGESVAEIRDVKPAGEIVADLVREAAALSG